MRNLSPPEVPRQRSQGSTLQPPLLIIGSPRSGTTFLTRMANRFLDTYVSRDAGLFLRFRHVAARYGDLAAPGVMPRLVEDLFQDLLFRRRFLERGFRFSAADIVRRIDEPTYAGLVRQILQANAESHGRRYWGNKRPSYALSPDVLEHVFPGARVVQIIRDGRDVVLSMRRSRGLLVEKNWYFAASDWKDHVDQGRTAGHLLGPGRYLEVTYEGLIEDPLGVLGRIGAFIGDDLATTLEARRVEILRRTRSDNSGKWRRQMPRAARRITERVAGDLLADLGYDVEFPELHGRPFSRAHRGLFQVDRLMRNVFTRDLRKSFNYRVNLVRGAMRRLGIPGTTRPTEGAR